MNFETVIGLEVHVELKTESKIFSPAPAHFGAEPNSNTNVIDWGYPGVLPVMNKAAIEFGMKAALALNCEISIFIPTIQKRIKFRNSINRSVMMGGSRSKWKAKRKRFASSEFIWKKMPGKTCTAKAVILMLI